MCVCVYYICIYIPKQMSFSDLTNSCNIKILSNHLYKLLLGLILYGYRFQKCLFDFSVRVSLS